MWTHEEVTEEALERLQAIGLAPAMAREARLRVEATESAEATVATAARAATAPAAAQAAPTVPPRRALMRVAQVQREGVSLHDGQHEHAARLLPPLRQALAEEGDAIAVGDWVFALHNSYGEWWVDERLPPANQLARRLHDGRDKVERVVIVSNVDTAMLVMGLDHDYNLRRLERYIALVRLAGVTPLVVLTKADLCGDTPARLAAAQALLPPGAVAVALDALADSGKAPLRELAPWLGSGQTAVMLGSSGAGKSTLTNALVGNSVQLTGANRGGDNRGRHTTTARTMHRAACGGCIIDTPGLRTLRLDGDADALAQVFDDIAERAAACRFRDCRHEGEPGCAVRGAVPEERLRNWAKLQRETRRDTQTALQRKAQLSVWKARARGARARLQAKRGE
jgi:ribosome biogenesis GTPase